MWFGFSVPMHHRKNVCLSSSVVIVTGNSCSAMSSDAGKQTSPFPYQLTSSAVTAGPSSRGFMSRRCSVPGFLLLGRQRQVQRSETSSRSSTATSDVVWLPPPAALPLQQGLTSGRKPPLRCSFWQLGSVTWDILRARVSRDFVQVDV